MTQQRFGDELVRSLKETLASLKCIRNDRQGRIASGVTDIDDCFISDKCDEERMCEIREQIRIIENGGTMKSKTLFDKNGVEVRVYKAKTKYGLCVCCEVDGKTVYSQSVEKLAVKSGFQFRTVEVPCWTKMESSGSGMFGAYTATYQVVRWHTNMATGEYVGYRIGVKE